MYNVFQLVQKISKVVEQCITCQSELIKDRRLDQVTCISSVSETIFAISFHAVDEY